MTKYIRALFYILWRFKIVSIFNSKVITLLGMICALVLGSNNVAFAQNKKAPQNDVSISDAAIASSNSTPAVPLTQDEAANHNIPCPSFWSVQANPSVENSLSYVHDSGKIAISVTYIASLSGNNVTPNTFARVSAEQMNCTLPVKSNVLSNAWAFTCDNDIEALVYGEAGDLVLLSISGRSDETESDFDSFISFLEYQSRRR